MRSSCSPNRLTVFAGLALLALLLHCGAAWSANAPSERVERAREAGISEAVINRLVEGEAAGRLGHEDTERILEILGKTRRENLPPEPFEAKVEEGLAKRVPASGIIAGLARKRENYHLAISALDAYTKKTETTYSGEDIARVSGSFNAGLSHGDVTRFADDAPPADTDMFVTALETLAFLKQAGFDAGLAETIVKRGLEKRTLKREWVFSSRLIAGARNRGMTDTEIADAAIFSLEKGEGLSGFMNRLGFTERNLVTGYGMPPEGK